MRRVPWFVASAIVFLFALPFVPTACSSSSSDSGSPDSGVDLDTTPDIPPYEEPILDGPLGVVIVLNHYDPVGRCLAGPAKAVGHPDGLEPDGALACSGTGDRCYISTDGSVFYSATDCIHGGNFLLPIDNEPYNDLGPCEPMKDLDVSLIKDCPAASCTFARDLVIDVDRGCAEFIDSRDCRDTVGAPTSCFCDPSSTSNVFVAYDGKSKTNVPSGYTACDSSNPSCAKALAVVDTVPACPIDVDAGDTGDASSEAGDAGADSTSGDATDAAESD